MSATPVPVPGKPMSLDKVIEAYPVLRQSLLANYDDCALFSYFTMLTSQSWSTHPQARGTIFHRAAAECLREMQMMDSEQIPQTTALAILEETLKQKDVPPRERVRLPLREIPVLRMAVAKFAKDNSFTIRKIIDIEKRLEATLDYDDDEGTIRTRRLSGTPDVMVMDPERDDGVIVIDWKDTWALPPEQLDPSKQAERGLSYHGYFQQRFYAWLILKNYPAVKWVTLREFYARRSEARPATVGRDKIATLEEELANLVREFDRSVASGKPPKLRYPEVENWEPSPGKHCHWCPLRRRCPVPNEVIEVEAVQTPEQAARVVGILKVAEETADQCKTAVRPYIEEHGPVAGKASKGRLAYGLKTNKSGKPEARWHTPAGSDRAPTRKVADAPLEDALREATAAVEDERVGT